MNTVIYARGIQGSKEALQSLIELKSDFSDSKLVIEGLAGWTGPIDILKDIPSEIDILMKSAYEDNYLHRKLIEFSTAVLIKNILNHQHDGGVEIAEKILPTLQTIYKLDNAVKIISSSKWSMEKDEYLALAEPEGVTFGNPTIYGAVIPTIIHNDLIQEDLVISKDKYNVSELTDKFVNMPDYVSTETIYQKKGYVAIIQKEEILFREHPFPTDRIVEYVEGVSDNDDLNDIYLRRGEARKLKKEDYPEFFKDS